MIEFDDETERKKELSRMINIETETWIQVDDLDRVIPFADEDMERTAEDKTSSVHFLRFELTINMIKALKNGAPLKAGITHTAYHHIVDPVPDNISQSLIADLD